MRILSKINCSDFRYSTGSCFQAAGIEAEAHVAASAASKARGRERRRHVEVKAGRGADAGVSWQ